MIFTLTVVVMLPQAAWAQRAKGDPHPDKPCVTKLSQTDNVYRVAFHPWCDLRELVRTFPVLDSDGKPLPVQIQLRGLYEANKDRVVDDVKIRHTVMRGCVLEGKPSPDADQEEREYCKGLVNYFAAPSNDSIAIIEAPRSRVLTYTEKLEQLSVKTCTVLETMPNPDVLTRGLLATCRKMGLCSRAGAAPEAVSEQPQSMSQSPQTVQSAAPVTSAQPQLATQNEQAVRITELERQLAASRARSSGSRLDQFSYVCLIAAGLMITLLAVKLYRDGKKSRAPIVAAYEKKLADFKATYRVSNEELVLRCEKLEKQLNSAKGEKASLEARLQKQQSQATRPPSSQLARDNEELVKEVVRLKGQKADLEFNVSAISGELQVSVGKIEALKKNLNLITGERNQLQAECEGLEQERDQALQSLAVAESRSEQAKARQAEAENRGRDLEQKLETELVQARSDAQAKDSRLTEVRQELARAESDLADVGAANAELVREKKSLEDKLAAIQATSTVKFAQDSPDGGSTSTVKLDHSFSSAQDRKLTSEDFLPAKQQEEPQMISVRNSDVSELSQMVQSHLDKPPVQTGESQDEHYPWSVTPRSNAISCLLYTSDA
ncbi:MAG: hypothetical protein QUS09_04415, partial [Methanotrichaceae archaeon]|nr:hypothetical protein [Methanotrichaceae archaeon]